VPTCIYCEKENLTPSIEHVVAEGLGGCLKLPAEAVCTACNNKVLGDAIDVPVREDLKQLLVEHGVVGKSGTAATMVVMHPDPREGKRTYRISKTAIASNERRKLLRRQGDTYEFRASSRQEFEKIRAELETKNPGKRVALDQIEERLPDVPEGHFREVDFRAPHWSRWAAKTCLNLIAYVWGLAAVRSSHFASLRAHVMGEGPTPQGLAFGGCGSDTVNADETPAEHRIELTSAGDRVVVAMISFDYCGFRYEGDGPPSLPTMTRRIVLDAANAKVASGESQ
jgi:hypothetical protein